MLKGGLGATLAGSEKQNLNANSLTVAKAVGTHQFPPRIVFAASFLAAQEHNPIENIVCMQKTRFATNVDDALCKSESTRKRQLEETGAASKVCSCDER